MDRPQQLRGLKVWFPDDLARILAAEGLHTAELEAAGAPAAYLAGREAVLRTLAAAFGLRDPVVPAEAATQGPTIDGTATCPEPPERWIKR